MTTGEEVRKKNVINKFGKSTFASYIRQTQTSTQTDRTIIESRDRNKERVTEKLWLQFKIWYMIFVHTNLDRYLHTYIYIHITEDTNTHIFGMNAFCIFTTHQTRYGATQITNIPKIAILPLYHQTKHQVSVDNTVSLQSGVHFVVMFLTKCSERFLHIERPSVQIRAHRWKKKQDTESLWICCKIHKHTQTATHTHTI